MKKYLLYLTVSLLFTSSVCSAKNYPQSFMDKAGNGLINIVSAPLEIPKNITHITNESNMVYGIVGGLLKGVMHTVGRASVGIIDLISAPIPSANIIYPHVIWENLENETHYGLGVKAPNDEQYLDGFN